MYEMLRNMAPPVGFGKKCPYKLAYKVNMMMINTGKVLSDIDRYLVSVIVEKNASCLFLMPRIYTLLNALR